MPFADDGDAGRVRALQGIFNAEASPGRVTWHGGRVPVEAKIQLFAEGHDRLRDRRSSGGGSEVVCGEEKRRVPPVLLGTGSVCVRTANDLGPKVTVGFRRNGLLQRKRLSGPFRGCFAFGVRGAADLAESDGVSLHRVRVTGASQSRYTQWPR